MKAVILEKKLFMAAVLKDDGTISKIINTGKVGDTIEINEGSTYPLLRYGYTLVLVLLIAFSALGYNAIAVKAYSYVSIDSDLSIEYTLNRLNRVIDITANDENSIDIVNTLKENNVKGQSIEKALELTKDVLDSNEYVVVSVSSDNDNNNEKIITTAKEVFSDYVDENILISKTTNSERQEAKDFGITTGKYVQIKENLDNHEKDINSEVIEQYKDYEVKDFFEKKEEMPKNNQPTNEPTPTENNDFKPEDNQTPQDVPQDEHISNDMSHEDNNP